MGPRRSFLTLALAGLCAGLLPRRGRASDDGVPPALRDAGLVRHGDGVWIFPQERRLRSKLGELPELRDAITVLERELTERVKHNREVHEATKPAIASLKQSLARLAKSDPKRPAIERQLAAEIAKSTPPDKLGGRRDIRALVAQLSQHRTTLTLGLLAARRTIPELRSEYARLARDNDVAQALAEWGRGNRLGPLRPLEPDLRKLAELDAVVFTAHVPIWLQSGHVRLTAIVAEQQPLTLTWREYPGHGLVLTSSASQALDLRPTDGGEVRDLDFGKGRKVRAQRTAVSSLRLGRWVVTDLPAWILAPEGEDLGSQLDSSALNGYAARCEPAALRLTLQSRQ